MSAHDIHNVSFIPVGNKASKTPALERSARKCTSSPQSRREANPGHKSVGKIAPPRLEKAKGLLEWPGSSNTLGARAVASIRPPSVGFGKGSRGFTAPVTEFLTLAVVREIDLALKTAFPRTIEHCNFITASDVGTGDQQFDRYRLFGLASVVTLHSRDKPSLVRLLRARGLLFRPEKSSRGSDQTRPWKRNRI
jgi:hypothetical protein